MADRRLLLVETVTRERWVFDSRFFPFIQGLARSLGDEVRWLCFGAELSIRKPRPFDVELAMHLPPEDVATLRRHLAELQPTHVILSHNLTPDGLGAIREASQRAAVLAISDHPAPPWWTSLRAWIQASRDRASRPRTPREERLAAAGDSSWSMTRTDWLLCWLGLAPGDSPLFGRYLVGTVTPDYRALMANEPATRFRPRLLLLGGTTCDHHAAVADNPRYAGLDLSGCAQRDGCAFCTWYRGPMSELDTDPVELAVAQLRRVLETTGGRDRCCGLYDLLDVRVFSRVDHFLEQVAELRLPPSTFHFEPRVDRALQVSERLERALATAERLGHALYIYRMGAESLVDEENERFNKCLTFETLDAGMRRLATLAAAHPAAFDFDRTLGYITCTPWTTLEMLSETVAKSIARGLHPKGIWLYTPLQLYRGSPITKLAERDGLLAPRFDDLSMLYEPAVNNVSFDSFLPWRFRDERVAAAFALMVRFTAAALRGTYPDDVFRDDELYARVCAWAVDEALLARPDLFAREVVTIVRDAPSPVDRPALLAAALSRYGAILAALRPQPVQPPPEPPTPARPPDARVRRLQSRIAALLERPAGRFRGVRAEVLPVQDDASTMLFRIHVSGRVYDVFLSPRSTRRPHYFQTRHYNACLGEDTPPRADGDLELLRALFDALDEEASRRRPGR